MANISKCVYCGGRVPGKNPILFDERNKPYRICSDKCTEDIQKREIAELESQYEAQEYIDAAIKKGMEIEGISEDQIKDGHIINWVAGIYRTEK